MALRQLFHELVEELELDSNVKGYLNSSISMPGELSREIAQTINKYRALESEQIEKAKEKVGRDLNEEELQGLKLQAPTQNRICDFIVMCFMHKKGCSFEAVGFHIHGPENAGRRSLFSNKWGRLLTLDIIKGVSYANGGQTLNAHAMSTSLPLHIGDRRVLLEFGLRLALEMAFVSWPRVVSLLHLTGTRDMLASLALDRSHLDFEARREAGKAEEEFRNLINATESTIIDEGVGNNFYHNKTPCPSELELNAKFIKNPLFLEQLLNVLFDGGISLESVTKSISPETVEKNPHISDMLLTLRYISTVLAKEKEKEGEGRRTVSRRDQSPFDHEDSSSDDDDDDDDDDGAVAVLTARPDYNNCCGGLVKRLGVSKMRGMLYFDSVGGDWTPFSDHLSGLFLALHKLEANGAITGAAAIALHKILRKIRPFESDLHFPPVVAGVSGRSHYCNGFFFLF